MLAILALAAAVILYVVFPHRGQTVPRMPWLGQVMRRTVDSLPTLDNRRARQQD